MSARLIAGRRRDPARLAGARHRGSGGRRPKAPARNVAVDAEVLAKVPYSERPPRYAYRLTEKGRDLWPVITTMRQWADKHAAPDGPPLQLIHRDCGEITEAVLTCSACGEHLDAGNVRAVPGPGEVEPLIRSTGAQRRP